MLLFLNMCSRVTLGNVLLNNVTEFEISESITEISNTAKITIPRNYAALKGKTILEMFSVGDTVTIEAGYDNQLNLEFTGYIREIESDYPLIIHCDDETYPLRQNSFRINYRSASLRQVLSDIIPQNIKFDCPDVNLGRFMIDNESSFQVLQRLHENHFMYSILKNGFLSVNLRDLALAPGANTHTYNLNEKRFIGNFTKKNELKFKRKEDYKLHVKMSALMTNGKRLTVEYGNKTKDAAMLEVGLPGNFSEDELMAYAKSIYNKRCYDGYTGTITGFGTPPTHAGDALIINDKIEPERSGKYMIESVHVSYNYSSVFSRENTLSYKLELDN